jgi:hypothetical protein
MPKLKYRFRVTLDNFGVPGTPTTELTKQVMNVTRPVLTFEEIKLPVYNSTIKLAGKHSWSNAELTLRDDVSNAVTQLVGQQLQKQFDFFEQSSAASGIDYKFTMRVELLDGGNGSNTPTVLEAFEFLGCFLQGVTYQGGDYGSATDPMARHPPKADVPSVSATHAKRMASTMRMTSVLPWTRIRTNARLGTNPRNRIQWRPVVILIH